MEPVIRYNVSPKLEHSGNPIGKRRVWVALTSLANQPSIFKFVVDPDTWEMDFAEIRGIMDELKLYQFSSGRVWIMPVGTTATEQMDGMHFLADKVLAEGWNLTPRLHTLIWGNERAR
jgi:hypothetical protein